MTLHLNEEKIVGGLLGVVTGDALGLPVQFLTREEVSENPIVKMRGGGVSIHLLGLGQMTVL